MPRSRSSCGRRFCRGAEHALRASAGLGRIGGDQLGAELRQGPADLGRTILVDLAAGLGRVPVVTRTVGIKRAEQPLLDDHLGECRERADGAFLLDEEGRVDLAGGVVHGNDQIPPLPRNPLVHRAVLVHQHARQGAARALAPMRPATRRRPFAAMGLKRQPHPVVAPREPMLLDQFLVEVLGREVPVARVEQLQDRHHRVHRNPPRRRPAQAAVVQSLHPIRLEPVPPAPKGALRYTQNRRRLRLAQRPRSRPIQNLRELHQPYPLQHLRPPHRHPLWSGGRSNRTDHVLPTAVISCVTDKHRPTACPADRFALSKRRLRLWRNW